MDTSGCSILADDFARCLGRDVRIRVAPVSNIIPAMKNRNRPKALAAGVFGTCAPKDYANVSLQGHLRRAELSCPPPNSL